MVILEKDSNKTRDNKFGEVNDIRGYKILVATLLGFAWTLLSYCNSLILASF